MLHAIAFYRKPPQCVEATHDCDGAVSNPQVTVRSIPTYIKNRRTVRFRLRVRDRLVIMGRVQANGLGRRGRGVVFATALAGLVVPSQADAAASEWGEGEQASGTPDLGDQRHRRSGDPAGRPAGATGAGLEDLLALPRRMPASRRTSSGRAATIWIASISATPRRGASTTTASIRSATRTRSSIPSTSGSPGSGSRRNCVPPSTC